MNHARCQPHSQSLHPAVFVSSLKSGQLVLLSRLLCSCLAVGIISSQTKLPPQSGLGVVVESGTFSASLASAVGWEADLGIRLGDALPLQWMVAVPVLPWHRSQRVPQAAHTLSC